MTELRESVLVLGLGNDLLGDDAVGLHVARAAAMRLAGVDGCAVRESIEMGLTLLDEISGCEHLLLVDSIETGAAPGFVHEFDADCLKGRRIAAPHFVGIAETLELGGLLGLPMPGDVQVFAIEVRAAYTIRLALTPDVQRAVAEAAERISARAISLLQPGALGTGPIVGTGSLTGPGTTAERRLSVG
jgi:hydrogenase maturation protease